jgi:amino acid transporter
MTEKHTLSPFMVTLISINIMLGSGIFINIAELARRTGALGFVCYACVGIMLLPLVFSMATLLRLYPAGSFYTFAAHNLSPFFGFISSWSYFMGKLGSAAIMIHASVLIVQQLLPALQVVNPLMLDTIILTIFIALNMLHMKTGTLIQGIFTTLKLIPIIIIIGVGILFVQGVNFGVEHQVWTGVPLALPLVVYALIGFEIACSLSAHIKNSQENGPKVIFISYAFAVCIVVLFQLFFYGILGPLLAAQNSFRDAYPLLFAYLIPGMPYVVYGMSLFCNLAIASSALGGAYGILFSNSWNLHILARHGHLIYASWFTQLNKYNIPMACVLTEGIICFLYLVISGGSQVVLQQLGVLGVISTLSLSVISLMMARMCNRAQITLWIPALGLVSCALLLAACIRGLFMTGPAALAAFCIIIILGCAMYYVQRHYTIRTSKP